MVPEMVPRLSTQLKAIAYCGFLTVLVLFFTPETFAAQAVLAWESNTEPDVEGYIVYGSTGSPCPPYDYIDTFPEVDMENPLYPRCVITGLDEDVEYFFVVTAYDSYGNESDYSNIVSTKQGKVECAAAGSGGGGAGCFISSTVHAFSMSKNCLVFLFLLGSFLTCLSFSGKKPKKK